MAAAVMLLVGGCGDGENRTADAENALAGNRTDPALRAALQDQILVDPGLAQQSNRDAARPPADPGRAPVPLDPASAEEARLAEAEAAKSGKLLRAPPVSTAPVQSDGAITLGELAQQQSKKPGGAAAKCRNAKTEYDMRWASRLPAEFPVYPRAAVQEAAALVAPGCTTRLVSFNSAAPMQSLLDYYYTQAVRGGFTAEHVLQGSDHVLAGARARDDGAYYLILSNRPGGGTAVDLIANNGR